MILRKNTDDRLKLEKSTECDRNVRHAMWEFEVNKKWVKDKELSEITKSILNRYWEIVKEAFLN